MGKNKEPTKKVVYKEEEFLPVSMTAKASTQPIYNPDLLENSLQSEVEQEHHVKSVSKELFASHNIDVKTEVAHNEINHITKIRFLDRKFKIGNVDALLESFLALRVSKKRQSRREFIDALQTENRNAQGTSILGKLMGRGGQ